MLQEGVSNHRHEGVTVKPVPGPPLEVQSGPHIILEQRRVADVSRRVSTGLCPDRSIIVDRGLPVPQKPTKNRAVSPQ